MTGRVRRVMRRAVNYLRRLISSHRGLAALLIACALALRVLVPAGFMPTVADGTLTVAICSGSGPMTMALAIPGLKHEAPDMQAQSPCAFADLALPWLGSADPIQLAAALAFILAIAIVATPPFRLRRERHTRPPLRGPPLTA